MAYPYQPPEKFEPQEAHRLPRSVRRERDHALAYRGDPASEFYVDVDPGRITGPRGWPREWVPSTTLPRARLGLPGRLPVDARDRTSEVVELIREHWLDALEKGDHAHADYHLSRMLVWSEVYLRGAAIRYLTGAGDPELTTKDSEEDRASLVGVLAARRLAERVEPLTDKEADQHRRRGESEEEIEAQYIRREHAPAHECEHVYRRAFVEALTTWKPSRSNGRALLPWAWFLVERRLRDWIDDVQPWLVFHDRHGPEFADLNAELAEAEDDERRAIIEAHGYVAANKRGRLRVASWDGKRIKHVGGAGEVENRYGRHPDLKHPKDYAGALPSHAKRRSMGSSFARRETARSEDAEAVFKFLELAGVYHPDAADPEYQWTVAGWWTCDDGDSRAAADALDTVAAVVLAASAKGKTYALRDGAARGLEAERRLGLGAFVDAFLLLRGCEPPSPVQVKRGRGRPPKQSEPRSITLLVQADDAMKLTRDAMAAAGALTPDDAQEMADAWERLYWDLRENTRANSEYMMGRLPENPTPARPSPLKVVKRDATRARRVTDGRGFEK